MRPSVAVVIPVFNEEAAIGQVVSAIPRGCADEVIVVDGGSSDRTAEVARAAGARVIVESRRGYGRACATGAQAARCDILAFLDGDGADDPAALPQLLELVATGKSGLALGARRPEPDAMPVHSLLGNKLAAALISALWRQALTDLPSFKVIRRDALFDLGMTEATYGWTIEMIVKSARSGLKVAELPLAYHRRVGGQSKVSGNLGTSIKASYAILSTLGRHGFGRSAGRPLLRRRALLLMAKAPIPGEAKTRLATSIGPEAAASVHRAFLQASLQTATHACELVALMCPDERHADELRRLVPEDVHVWPQQRPGLMAGITEAFERAYALGAEDVLVGETDSPTLPSSYLERAFEVLAVSPLPPRRERARVREARGTLVLGPCADGGYYLVGASGVTPATARELFEGEAYEGSTICRRTAERARGLGLTVEVAPEWYDVDTIDELQRLRTDLNHAPGDQFAQLREALAALGQGADVLALDRPHAS